MSIPGASLLTSSTLHSTRTRIWQRPSVLLVVALVGGILLRLSGLGDALDHDEAYTWEAFASRSVSTIATHYPVPNNHIFHTFLVKASAAMFGVSEVALRIPALAGGGLTILATWWFACAYAGRVGLGVTWMPVLAASIVALSPEHASWSQVARGYTLITLFSAVAGGSLIRAQLARERIWWPLYAVSLFLALYTQPSAVLLAVGLAAWSLVSAVRADDRRVLTASLAGSKTIPPLQRTSAISNKWCPGKMI